MKNTEQRYFGELRKLNNGAFKLVKIKKLVRVNQHKRYWQPVNSRTLARELNTSGLVIK